MRRDPGRLGTTDFDLLVVGGGIHGAWIARRAAEAGLCVALIERNDFACATSSNSLNILHGGLRYLQHLDLVRMRASIRARREHLRSSPHLIQPLPCVMPLGNSGIRSPWIVGPALLLNEFFSADRNAGVPVGARLPRGGLMSRRDFRLRSAPLGEVAATSGALWWDALSLDSPRLCLETVIAAERAGAVVANRVEAVRYLVADGEVHGVEARDLQGDAEFEIRATVVANATGPCAGTLADASRLPTPYLPTTWVGAMNVIFSCATGLGAAVALPSASRVADGSALLRRVTRELFFVPWHGALAVGTDYVPLDKPPAEVLRAPQGAVHAFVQEIARVAPQSGADMETVSAVHWGILPGAAGSTPAKAPILASGADAGARGLVVVIGEKLTSAPTLSQAALERVLTELTARGWRGRTSVGAAARQGPLHEAGALIQEASIRLSGRYGQDWTTIFVPYANRPELFEPVLDGSDILPVEIVHAVREEMACDLDDLLLRRLALAPVGLPDSGLVRSCAEIASPEFGWSNQVAVKAVADFESRLRHHLRA